MKNIYFLDHVVIVFIKNIFFLGHVVIVRNHDDYMLVEFNWIALG